MADTQGLIAAYVTQMQRSYYRGSRGIATPEQRSIWAREAVVILDDIKAAGWDEARQAVYDRLNDDALDSELAGENPYRNGEDR